MDLDPDLTRVVVSDVHGNYEAMKAVLENIGMLDRKTAQRNEGFYAVQLGDLVHMTDKRLAGDLVTLHEGERIFDQVLCGNHELWHAWKVRAGIFDNMTRIPDPRLIQTLNRMGRSGHLMPTCAIDGWLISHAGIHRTYQHALGARDAEEASEEINNRFMERIQKRMEDPIFDSLGRVRSLGKEARAGGVFWCDVVELAMSGSRLQQIVGHTPLSVKIPLRLSHTLWAIDPGAMGVSVLVKEGEEGEWVTYMARRELESGTLEINGKL